MKKATFAFACVAVLLLTSASVWEGSAVVAASGELPETGYYIATNSFPKNTVVDVKNLETDSTIRTIVAGGLDSPGLLAALSVEAAAAIGLDRRTVGRIRVTMPADPIAFSRFTDGLAESADPDRNPRAIAGAGSAGGEAEKPLSTPQNEAKAAETAPAAAAETAVAAAEPKKETAVVPVKAETPPAAAASPERSVDVPENYVPPKPITPETPAKAESTVLAILPETTEKKVELVEPEAVAEVAEAAEAVPETTAPTRAAEEKGNGETVLKDEPAPAEAIGEETEPEAVAEASKPSQAPAESPAEEVKDEAVPAETVPPAVAETAPAAEAPPAEEEAKPEPSSEIIAAVPEEKPQDSPAETVDEKKPPVGEVVLNLEPAEERPPNAETVDLAQESFVEPVASVEAIAAKPEGKTPELSPDLFLEPLSAPKSAEKTEEKPAITEPAATVPAAQNADFSSRIVGALDKGKYYVQLGAFTESDMVKEALSRIGMKIPAAVQIVTEKNGKPVYRVFIGPVNQGESGALLYRFKRIGYQDAFIKKGI